MTSYLVFFPIIWFFPYLIISLLNTPNYLYTYVVFISISGLLMIPFMLIMTFIWDSLIWWNKLQDYWYDYSSSFGWVIEFNGKRITHYSVLPVEYDEMKAKQYIELFWLYRNIQQSFGIQMLVSTLILVIYMHSPH